MDFARRFGSGPEVDVPQQAMLTLYKGHLWRGRSGLASSSFSSLTPSSFMLILVLVLAASVLLLMPPLLLA